MNTVIDTLITWHTRYPAIVEGLLALVKTSCLLAITALMVATLQRRSARARSWVWRIALASLTLLALWQIRPATLEPIALQMPVVDYSVISPEPVIVPSRPFVFTPDPWQLTALRALDHHGAKLWLFGFAALFAMKVLRSLVGITWLRRHSREAPSDLAKECPPPLRCRLSSRITTPLITGLWQATVWLPEDSVDWPQVKRRAAFQHELAHHLRSDSLWQWLGTLAACAWWWQPMGWLALHRLKNETEQAADDWTVTQSIAAPDYAEALVNIAQGASNSASDCIGIAMARTSEIEHRVRALLKPNQWRNKLGFLACAGLALLAISLTGIVLVSCKKQAPRFVSTAKLVAGGRMVSSTSGAPAYSEYLQDFYGTVIETLESAAMRRQASERARVLNPELQECDVEIKVTQNKGSAIFNVAAIGTEPKFTRVFLDALLDEFIAFRGQIREQQRNKALTALAEDVVKREASLKEKGEKLQAFKRNNNVIVLTNGQYQTAEFLKQLTVEKNRLMMRVSTLDLAKKDVISGVLSREQEAAEPGQDRRTLTQAETELLKARTSINILKAEHQSLLNSFKPDHPTVLQQQSKVAVAEAVMVDLTKLVGEQWAIQQGTLERQISVLDAKIQEFNAKASDGGGILAEHERLQKDFDEAEKAYNEMLALVRKFQVGEDMSSDHVTIMQRAEAAVEETPHRWF